VSPALATIPAKVGVVFYIPPGTIFDAVCGAMLHHRLRNHVALNSEQETMRLVQAIKSEMSFTAKSRDYSKLDKMFWAGQNTYKEYPKLCSAIKNAEFVFDYNLKGMKPTDSPILQKIRWGLHEIGWAGKAVKPLGPAETSTLGVMLSAAAADAGAEHAMVHCIFCRVEQFLDKDAEDYAHTSMKTTKIMHVHIFEHEQA
jgi:hypothetical protein